MEHVNNQIEILLPSPNDDRIHLAVAHAIFNDERLFKYSLRYGFGFGWATVGYNVNLGYDKFVVIAG